MRRRFLQRTMLISLLLPLSGMARAGADRSVISLEKDMRSLFHHASSPFVVQVFREDALGDYIGVVYAGVMGAPGDGSWELHDRFWQQERWCADVTSFAWASGGRVLYVATSPIYGTGSVFRLHLPERKVEVLFDPERDHPAALKEKEEYIPEVIAVDETSQRATVRFRPSSGGEARTLVVPIQ